MAAASSSMDLAEKVGQAGEVAEVRPDEAIKLYRDVIHSPATDPEALKVKEQAITHCGELLAKQGKAQELRALLTEIRPYFALIPKAKTAKLVRTFIDLVAKVPNTTQLQVEWTRQEKRTFLRQRVEARLASLLLETKEFTAALTLISSLLREVKRLDDKLLLVDIHLIESRVHHALRNLPKAKAALTAARTAANAIYVPPAQQGQIDLQSGVLHAEEKDYKTAYSYFFEAFEQFNNLEDPKAVLALKYMLLCKVMTNQAEDVSTIVNSKASLKYSGPEVEAMRAIASAYHDRSLKELEKALATHKDQLANDPIIHSHLSELYGNLLEQNLIRIIEPFSRVEITHVASLIGLPLETVEDKLSQMILDQKFKGTLDQGAGNLIVFDEVRPDSIYPAALDTIGNMSQVVDSLYLKSTKVLA
eukprot:jgi/Chlat1/451/Chrsp103S01066